MRTTTRLATAAVLAAAAVGASPTGAFAAATPSPGAFCRTTPGLVGGEEGFFAKQGGCASSLARGPIVNGPFGPGPSYISRAGYITQCQRLGSGAWPGLAAEYNDIFHPATPVTITSLPQCATVLKGLPHLG